MLAKRSVAFLAATFCALATGLAFAQSHPPGHQASGTAPAPEAPHVFCPTMKTGQLCSHGTADRLQVTGAKRDQWVEAARRYNKAVDAATVQLLEDAKKMLTPEEQRLVESWFTKGLLNPQINRLLATP
jgi:hypothetical protein